MHRPITITVNNEQTFAYDNEFSLLDSLEKQQIEVNYNCRNGCCGRCKVLLQEGQVKWIQDSLVTLAKNEILSCSCIPVMPIKIDIL